MELDHGINTNAASEAGIESVVRVSKTDRKADGMDRLTKLNGMMNLLKTN